MFHIALRCKCHVTFVITFMLYQLILVTEHSAVTDSQCSVNTVHYIHILSSDEFQQKSVTYIINFVVATEDLLLHPLFCFLFAVIALFSGKKKLAMHRKNKLAGMVYVHHPHCK